MARLRVVLFSPGFYSTDVGESYVAYKWAEGLSEVADVTVLAYQRSDRPSQIEALPKAEVVTWPEPGIFRRFERLSAMAKPYYPLLYRKARRWMRDQMAQGRRFDIAHQIMPLAARYPSPFTGLGVPYAMGPLGGTLPTPAGFEGELDSARWYTRFRAIDGWRFRNDPWLRKSYAEAALILGVAPYMCDALASISLKRFECLLELGIEQAPAPRPEATPRDGLKLLHVGRAVRTKGLRDVVRAMGQLRDMPGVTLTSAGDGEDLAHCQAEAEALGVADRVRFLGRVPRAEVDRLYDDHDVFVFPSFREPTGGVLYEAMAKGLPIVTVDYGGPAYIVDDTSGIRLALSTPETLSDDIAQTVRGLAANPAARQAMGKAAQARVAAEGLWPRKVDRLMNLYSDVLSKNGQG